MIPKKSGVWSRNKKTANGECLSWCYECVYCFALSFTHIKLIAYKWGHLLFSDHYMEFMLRRVRKGTLFHQHKWTWAIDRSECHVLHGVLWKNFVRSAKKRWRKWNENPKQTVISMILGLLNWPDTTRKQLKIHFAGISHGYDEWRDYDNERNYFPFVRLEKMFFPAE